MAITPKNILVHMLEMGMPKSLGMKLGNIKSKLQKYRINNILGLGECHRQKNEHFDDHLYGPSTGTRSSGSTLGTGAKLKPATERLPAKAKGKGKEKEKIAKDSKSAHQPDLCGPSKGGDKWEKPPSKLEEDGHHVKRGIPTSAAEWNQTRLPTPEESTNSQAPVPSKMYWSVSKDGDCDIGSRHVERLASTQDHSPLFDRADSLQGYSGILGPDPVVPYSLFPRNASHSSWTTSSPDTGWSNSNGGLFGMPCDPTSMSKSSPMLPSYYQFHTGLSPMEDPAAVGMASASPFLQQDQDGSSHVRSHAMRRTLSGSEFMYLYDEADGERLLAPPASCTGGDGSGENYPSGSKRPWRRGLPAPDIESCSTSRSHSSSLFESSPGPSFSDEYSRYSESSKTPSKEFMGSVNGENSKDSDRWIRLGYSLGVQSAMRQFAAPGCRRTGNIDSSLEQ